MSMSEFTLLIKDRYPEDDFKNLTKVVQGLHKEANLKLIVAGNKLLNAKGFKVIKNFSFRSSLKTIKFQLEM
jgi:hypothetical protein